MQNAEDNDTLFLARSLKGPFPIECLYHRLILSDYRIILLRPQQLFQMSHGTSTSPMHPSLCPSLKMTDFATGQYLWSILVQLAGQRRKLTFGMYLL